ncbi:gastrula zinc finger protein XlCGF57.1 [Anabrus simplex]|uniref:gastrula zinc finger protein XlCGF57.1 n=1 Tax=Anabrus simplex TaxID=316456 RepID=UPI0035A36831
MEQPLFIKCEAESAESESNPLHSDNVIEIKVEPDHAFYDSDEEDGQAELVDEEHEPKVEKDEVNREDSDITGILPDTLHPSLFTYNADGESKPTDPQGSKSRNDPERTALLSVSEEANWVCHFCGQVCKTEDLVKKHLAEHSGEQSSPSLQLSIIHPYATASERFASCDRCSKPFPGINQTTEAVNIRGKKSHFCLTCGDYMLARSDSRLESYSCTLCEETFSHRSLFISHMVAHTGQVPLYCNTCGKAFIRASHLNRHERNHAGYLPHTCSYCGKAFADRSNLDRHVLTHTGERPHPCNTCGKAFTLKSHLRTHMLTHTGEKRHSCKLCGKEFTLKCNLELHMIIHSGQKEHCCTICGKAFACKAYLTRHLMTHTGEMPYSCSSCGKAFSNRSNLNAHTLTHTGQKPFSCSACGKAFTQRSHLKTHILTHTGQKRYTCAICTKGFTRRVHFDKHMLNHKVFMPHSCKSCGKTFPDAIGLDSHMLTHSEGITGTSTT